MFVIVWQSTSKRSEPLHI